jgi:hypothetical protein
MIKIYQIIIQIKNAYHGSFFMIKRNLIEMLIFLVIIQFRTNKLNNII